MRTCDEAKHLGREVTVEILMLSSWQSNRRKTETGWCPAIHSKDISPTTLTIPYSEILNPSAYCLVRVLMA